LVAPESTGQAAEGDKHGGPLSRMFREGLGVSATFGSYTMESEPNYLLLIIIVLLMIISLQNLPLEFQNLLYILKYLSESCVDL
jgi:hypothetical protein